MKINELVLSQTLKARGVYGPRFEWSQGRKGWVYIVDCQKKKNNHIAFTSSFFEGHIAFTRHIDF